MLDRVKALAPTHSRGEIAREINLEFGTELSRNAVIGIMGRRGIAGRTVSRPEAAERAQRNRPPPPPKYRRAMRQPPAAAPEPAPPPPPTRAETVPSMACSLMELSDKRCRFPIGEPGADGFHFCGAPPVDGAPYCRPHCQIAYNPAYSTRAARR